MTNIKVFSDFACPFCYIGFSIANKLIQETPDINIEWLPYELDPDLSLEGVYLTNHIPQEQIDMSYRRIERLGSEYGLIYNSKIKNLTLIDCIRQLFMHMKKASITSLLKKLLKQF